MTWTFDINSTDRKFKTGDIIRALDTHKDRISRVVRVDHPTIYLEAASGTYIYIFSRTYQDLRHTIQLVPPAVTYIYSAIENSSDSSTNSTSNDNSSDSDLDIFNPRVLVKCHKPSKLALLQWDDN